jgi:hypothetical protein
MSVLRWVITDPTDIDPTTNTYTFPRNPESMTSIFHELPITAQSSTRGHALLWEGATQAKAWSFQGAILDKQHLLDLHLWVLTKKRRLILTDHFGRAITLVFNSLEVVPKRRTNVYYSHDYTVNALIISSTAPTVANSGPA